MKKVWYTHRNLKPQGPFTLEEIRLKIYRGELGPQDLISNQEYEEGRWICAEGWNVFEKELFPAKQSFIPGVDVNIDLKEWVVLSEDPLTGQSLQEGPYSVSDIISLRRAGRNFSSSLVWKSGLSGWARLYDRPEFQDITLPSL